MISNIDKNIKQSLTYCLKKDGPFKWGEILGFTKDELLEQLKKNFKQGMNFSNYGEVWGCSFFIPRRLYTIRTIKDNDFKKCWSLKNIKPEYLENCYRQKKEILESDLNEQSLWDILPNNFDKYLKK